MRRRIRREVEQIEPLDDQERACKAEVLAWIDSGAELCRRRKPDIPPRHLIGYFAVVDGDHVLLVDHINAGLWLPTGGHVEPGEHPRQTVRREAMEELGIRAELCYRPPLFVTITETVGATAGHTDVSLWYVLRGRRQATPAFDRNEFHDARWFHVGDMPPGRTDPQMHRFVAKLQQRGTAAMRTD